MTLRAFMKYEMQCDKCKAIRTSTYAEPSRSIFIKTLEDEGWLIENKDCCPDCRRDK